MAKVAIITGASRGLGHAIAIRLCKDGFRVALNDIPDQRNELESLRDHLSATYNSDSYIAIADVSSDQEVESMVSDVARELGSVDVMVANAGIAPISALVDTSTEDFRRICAVNLDGVFNCYKFAARQMIKQGKGGRLLAASSVAGKHGWGQGLGSYSATKFAVRGLTHAASRELQQHGITVNAYAPGSVRTAMSQAAREGMSDEERAKFEALHTDESLFPTPEDVAATVSFLVSDDASKITGQTIMINNGSFCD